MNLEPVYAFIRDYPNLVYLLKVAGILLLCWLVYLAVKRYLLRWLSKLVKRSQSDLDDILLNSGLLQRMTLILPIIILFNFSYLAGSAEEILRRLITAAMILIIATVLSSGLKALTEIQHHLPLSKRLNLKSYAQVTRLVMYLTAVIVMIATLIGQSPVVLLSGIGALTAVLLLIFRDTILSFVASMQLSAYDLVNEGDWIEIPKYGADGDVIDISLHTIRVQNWDKTIVVIPTHKLLEDSFKNWRGMTQSGGRRIKRAIYIDVSSIKFCDEEMLNDLEKSQLLTDYIRQKRDEIDAYNHEHGFSGNAVSSRRMTNIGTFRAYLKSYLKNHPKINSDMTFMVRQLPVGPTGLPIEIYVFSNDIQWVNYEEIQSDIFDHILAVVPRFGLKIFQHPTGSDFNKLTGNDLKSL